MAQVNLTINKQTYSIGCRAGDEDHIRQLASDIDNKIQALSQKVGNMGESHLLVMAAILLADELADYKAGYVPKETASSKPSLDPAFLEKLEKIAVQLENA